MLSSAVRRRAPPLVQRRAAQSAATGPWMKLASGHSMPAVSLGSWKSPPGKVTAAIDVALKAGYRGLDTANDYDNEPEVGAAIAKAIADGVVKREDLFVQSKLWNANHRPEHVPIDLERSLEDLKLTYVDSYVIHWPNACPSTGKVASTRINGARADHHSKGTMFPLDDAEYFAADKECHFVETWKAMEKLVDAGLVKSLGVSNFNKKQVEEVMAIARHPVSVLQNEAHAYLQQKDLIDFCRFNKIVFQAFSPLGSGETNLQVAPPPTGCIPLKDPHINKLAEKYGKDAGQIMLRWAVQRPIAVVSKSVTPSRVENNFKLFDWELSAEDMQSFDQLNCGWRHLHWRETSHHPNYPFFDELPHGYQLEKCTIFAPGT